MDLWVVAAAAGVGYMSKHLQNLSLSEKEKLVESYSKISNLRQSEPRNFLQQIWDETCPLHRLARKGALRESSSGQNDVLDRPLEMDQFGGDSDSLLGWTSTSGSVRMVEDINVLRLSSPSPGFSGRESCPHNMQFMGASTQSSCRLCRYKLLKSRSSGHVLEPLGSTESNLEKVDENVHISLPTPLSPTMGPVLVTDGNVEEDTIWDACCNEDSTFSSAPSSNNFESVELQKQVKGSQERALGGAFESPGPPSGMLLFLIGLTIGIMPEVFTYTREIKKLNEQLKQAENLVQDLQDELNMKDKLTVKELVAEGSQPLSTKVPTPFGQELTVSCSEPEAKDITSYDCKMANNDEKAENPYLMSEIEAELEAELERLGLNMDMERTSEFVELDPQYEIDTIQGEIKLDAVRKQYDNASKSESDEESGTTNGRTPPANYAVSPRELSIRLHEVIESVLEARIKELETALQNNQNKFHSLESQCITSLGSAYGDGESLSTPESLRKHSDPESPPVETIFEENPNCRNSGFITQESMDPMKVVNLKKDKDGEACLPDSVYSIGSDNISTGSGNCELPVT